MARGHVLTTHRCLIHTLRYYQQTLRVMFLLKLTSPDTVKWSSSSMSGIVSKRSMKSRTYRSYGRVHGGGKRREIWMNLYIASFLNATTMVAIKSMVVILQPCAWARLSNCGTLEMREKKFQICRMVGTTPTSGSQRTPQVSWLFHMRGGELQPGLQSHIQ